MLGVWRAIPAAFGVFALVACVGNKSSAGVKEVTSEEMVSDLSITVAEAYEKAEIVTVSKQDLMEQSVVLAGLLDDEPPESEIIRYQECVLTGMAMSWTYTLQKAPTLEKQASRVGAFYTELQEGFSQQVRETGYAYDDFTKAFAMLMTVGIENNGAGALIAPTYDACLSGMEARNG